MFVRTLDEIAGTERDVSWGNGQSHRLLIEEDGMGFAHLDTIVWAGTDNHIQYRNHLEAVQCIAGKGTITDVAAGKGHAIAPGVMYVLNNHDLHRQRADEDTRFICVFIPPL